MAENVRTEKPSLPCRYNRQTQQRNVEAKVPEPDLGSNAIIIVIDGQLQLQLHNCNCN